MDRQRIRDLGERRLIRLLSGYMDARSNELPVPIGDDGAVATVPAESDLILTTDMLVEGTHFFRREDTDWYLLGRKAMAANVSDVAAMGGRPAHALVSLGLPGDFAVDDLEAMYRGLQFEAIKSGTKLVGGDTAHSPVLIVNIALTGWKYSDCPTPLRSRARPGQKVYLTGTVGASQAGLELLTKPEYECFRSEPWTVPLLAAHLSPTPRPKVGEAIAEGCPDAAMIDISDSLFNELHLLSKASDVGFEIALCSIPVSNDLLKFTSVTGRDPLELALFSGEEYQLLFTSCYNPESPLRDAEIDCTLTCIGITAAGREVIFLNDDGSRREFQDTTFSHFGEQ